MNGLRGYIKMALEELDLNARINEMLKKVVD